MPCIQPDLSQDYSDFIIRYFSFSQTALTFNSSAPGFSQGQKEESCFSVISSQYAVYHMPLAETLPLTLNRFSYPSIPKLYTLLDTSSMESSGILTAFAQPSLALRGRGTLIGIVDTGIDYRNPIFLGSDRSTRILGLWDQTEEGPGIMMGNILEDIPYGREYTREEINRALEAEDPFSVVPSRDESGHGTLLAGIAAGNETDSASFTGAAPEAFLAVVKLKQAKQYLRDYYLIPSSSEAYQENDIMMGIKYLLLVARRHRLPLTILISLGTNMGSHEGTSPLARYLDTVSAFPGVVTVIAAGNETGYSHHYFGTVEADEEFEDVELRIASGEEGFTMEMWTQEPELFSVGFLSPTGELIGRIPNNSPMEQRITFLLEDTVIYLNYQVAEFETGSQLIVMRFVRPTPGIWRLRVYNSLYLKGAYHLWLPAHGFLSEDTFFLRPHPDTVITEPGNASLPITVGAYNHRSGGIYIHSSRGYTRLGRVKPDLAAPGVDVEIPSSSGLSPIRITGTSAAAAHAAGAAANLLSWAFRNGSFSYMNTSIAKTFLIRGAERNPVFTYPNREWGYGTLNLYNAFLRMRE